MKMAESNNLNLCQNKEYVGMMVITYKFALINASAAV